MADVMVFKIQSLSEGGFVTYAPNYEQFSENYDLALKRLIVQAEGAVKTRQAEIREQNQTKK